MARQQGFSDIVKTAAATACVFMFAQTAAGAAGLPPDGEGIAPLSQWFVSERVSLVRKGDTAACVIHHPIAIRTSDYAGPDGRPVPPGAVRRSPAAGLQVLVSTAESGAARPALWRVVFKYPVSSPVLVIDGARYPVSHMVETAGDSLAIRQGPVARHLARAFASGRPVHVSGRSRDTGRRVRDVLTGPTAAERDLCRAVLAAPPPVPDAGVFTLVDGPEPFGPGPARRYGPAKAAAPPNGALGLRWGEVLPGRPDPDALQACGMTGHTRGLERRRIESARGFLTPFGVAWLTRDRDGRIDKVYVPGVFQAWVEPGGGWIADVSVAAQDNDPFRDARVKGCLGTRAVAMCRSGRHLGECENVRVAGLNRAGRNRGAARASGDPEGAGSGGPLLGSSVLSTATRATFPESAVFPRIGAPQPAAARTVSPLPERIPEALPRPVPLPSSLGPLALWLAGGFLLAASRRRWCTAARTTG